MRPGQGSRKGPAVEQDVALAIAADEMAEAHGVVDGGPAVCVDRHRVAYRDARIEDANLLILEDQPMMPGRGDDGVKFRGPGPRFVHYGLVR